MPRQREKQACWQFVPTFYLDLALFEKWDKYKTGFFQHRKNMLVRGRRTASLPSDMVCKPELLLSASHAGFSWLLPNQVKLFRTRSTRSIDSCETL